MKQIKWRRSGATQNSDSKRTKIRIGSLAMCAVLIVSILTAMMPVASAATQDEVDAAIVKGLAHLATQQNPDGSFGTGPIYYLMGQTGTAILAFEKEGHFPGGDTAYSANVEKGFDYLFELASTTPINSQEAGDPDTSGNGVGVVVGNGYGEELYTTSIAAMAIVGSNTPDRVITTGPLAGHTYKDALTDIVDYLAWAQNDQNRGDSRGGWRYGPNYGDSDNSVSQWPVLALVSAELWGVNAPAWVKTELNFWINYIQNDANGASGYTTPDNWNLYSAMARTGALLVEMYYVGDTTATPRMQNALTYITANWEAGGAYGNKGDYYTMYALYKGLEYLKIATLTSGLDWHGDYTDWLLAHQESSGGWPKDSEWGSAWLDTGWAILILQGTGVQPVEVDVVIAPACAWTTGYEVKVDYSAARVSVDGTLTIYKDDNQIDQVTLTDFTGSATYTKTIESDTAGSHTYKAVLDVTAGTVNLKVEDTGSVTVYQAPTVGDIPDQLAPFTEINLDSYLTVDPAATVTWAASGMDKLVVTIDPDTHVATITNPEDSSAPETITFTAAAKVCDISKDTSDSATFTPNRAPDVSKAEPSLVCLWPPNKELVDVTINGVTDPDNDQLTIRIDKVTSDESPDSALGAGGAKHSPDAVIIKKSGADDVAQLRAERSGTGDGRVYVIHFTATDGHGAATQGTVQVKVPHDQSTPCTAVDSGQDYVVAEA